MDTEALATPVATGSTADIPTRIAILETQFSLIQGIPKEQAKPWYRTLSSLLSVIALIFSLGTTGVSYYRTYTQDIQSSRQELRTILQRISAIPRENFDYMQKYKDDPTSMQQIGGYYNQENALLAKQAAEIARHLPPKYVSATEFYSVAVALGSAWDPQGESEFLKLTKSRATELNDDVAARRSIAALDIIQGHTTEGRAEFQDALGVFANHPGYDPYTQAQTNALTQLQWANVEAGKGALQDAAAHVDAAEQIVNTLPFSIMKQNLVSQIAQMRGFMRQGALPQVPNAISGLVPASSPTAVLPSTTGSGASQAISNESERLFSSRPNP